MSLPKWKIQDHNENEVLKHCIECDNNQSAYDEISGEYTCDICGLVIMLTPLEETSNVMMPGKDGGVRERVSITESLGSVIGPEHGDDKRVRNLRRAAGSGRDKDRYKSTWMRYLSNYNPNPPIAMKEHAEYIYDSLKDKKFRQRNAEAYGASIAFVTLRHHNIGVDSKQFCKTTGQDHRTLMRMYKRMKKALGDSIRPRQIDISSDVQRILTDILGSYENDTFLMIECIEILRGIKEVFPDEAFTTTRVVAGVWLTSRFIERDVALRDLHRTQGISEVAIRNAAYGILSCLGMESEQVVAEYYPEFKRNLKGPRMGTVV